MVDTVSFKTRARTVDHLGREQIADCPTAVSELWKNAYDAYARRVALHIYRGEPAIAALIDDGHGMNQREFIEKWLVIGTESKAGLVATSEQDRNGLRPRPRQGQKGIGRLSCAALGPLLLFASKRVSSPFIVALIDWRLFENPFLFLDDVQIPIVEVTCKEEILQALPAMFDKLLGNVWGDGRDEARDKRLTSAWSQFDASEAGTRERTTRSAIEQVIINTAFDENHLSQWPVWNGTSEHGTALLVADVAFDLQAQIDGQISLTDEQPAKQARERLFQTLSNFIDPFADSEKHSDEVAISDFECSVTAWNGDLRSPVISKDKAFGFEHLEDLEHVIDGHFDESGIFRGKTKIFGKWQDEEIIITPKSLSPLRADSRVGPFDIRIGTFEQDILNSSLAEEIWTRFSSQAEKYAGFRVYRDGLRVMPYGREDNDFFQIEKRRSAHAGREFWSHRRMFGRVALSRDGNPNLKDKAGREGFIDNKAAKVFRDLVENLLMTAARRYFGSDAKVRGELLPEVRANRAAERAHAAEKSLRSRKRREFRHNLTDFLPTVRVIRDELEEMATLAANRELPTEESRLLKIRDRLMELQQARNELTFGAIPRTLGSLEDDYKDFRRSANRASELITQLNGAILFNLEKMRPKDPRNVAYSELSRYAVFLQTRLKRWNAEARQLLASENERLEALVDERGKRYHAICLPLLDGLTDIPESLTSVLTTLVNERDKQDAENSEIFEAYLSTLKSLKESIDLDALVAFSTAQYESAREEITRLNSLAQLGITVEIIGHEIEGLDMTISAGLRELPESAKNTSSFRTIKTAHEALGDRLRFLSPLKLSGERVREWVSGRDILSYCEKFLAKSISHGGVEMIATEAFLNFRVFEESARIYPVFINLISNALYWVAQSDRLPRKILFSWEAGEVIVSDSGPGVDDEDVEHLFSLFFTRKIRGGRGVGLYLCRANLAAGGHMINYITDPERKKLDGANFSIEFKGSKNV